MSERRSYAAVIIFALIVGAASAWLWLQGSPNMIERVLIVAAVFFCLFLLIKQRWALAGISITLLAATIVYFTQAWYFPIIEEDTSLILPNVYKLIVSVIFFILLGRQSIDDRFA
jgi:predicted neutral ceramidase superfamily lipid hydrolase